mgnify:CR=1 FL=1
MVIIFYSINKVLNKHLVMISVNHDIAGFGNIKSITTPKFLKQSQLFLEEKTN